MRTLRVPALASLVLTLAFILAPAAAAKETWIQVRSKNFLLVGNASEKDIRKVGTRLEQFRETFRRLFTGVSLTSPVPTSVIVFKSDSYYNQFKPRRTDGKIDTAVTGYFQPGEDVNYITLSTEGEDAHTFRVIFHEYVHSIVNTHFGKSQIPAWFNEGLAEYYETFAIEGHQRVKLGLPQNRHLPLLQTNKLSPLDTLFKTTNSDLLDLGTHSRSLFYAQSWALIHYLVQNGRSDGLNKFLTLLLKNAPPEQAFRDAFQIDYQQMETELRRYTGQSIYKYTEILLRNKLVFDSEMQASILGEASANAYLGDLLYHTHREDDAEPYLLNALRLEPGLSMASTTLGLVKLKQRKFDEARQHLEKAIAGDQHNHIALFRYAYVLSREARDEFGFVRSIPADTATKMRSALKRAIAINPTFTESYEMLAFLNLVTNQDLDETLEIMKTALQYQPGNQRYLMRMAEMYSHQQRFAEATEISDKIAKTTDEPDLRQRAESLMYAIREIQGMNERRAAALKAGAILPASTGPNGRPRQETDPPMTREELEKAHAESTLRSINAALRKASDSERRVIGRVQRIDCRGGRSIKYLVRTPGETFTLTSKDFQVVELNVLGEGARKVSVGCEEDISALNAVVTYKPAATGIVRGDLVSLEFVPTNFRMMTGEEMLQPPPRIVAIDSVGPDGSALSPGQRPPPRDTEEERREAILQAIRNAVRQPAEGEKRELGYLERIECTDNKAVYHLRAGTRLLRLYSPAPAALQIRVFAPDLAGMNFGCTTGAIEYPAVFVFSESTKAPGSGIIVGLDFVPKSFVLN